MPKESAFERYVREDAERWREVHDRISALTGMLFMTLCVLSSEGRKDAREFIEAIRVLESGSRMRNAGSEKISEIRKMAERLEKLFGRDGAPTHGATRRARRKTRR